MMFNVMVLEVQLQIYFYRSSAWGNIKFYSQYTDWGPDVSQPRLRRLRLVLDLPAGVVPVKPWTKQCKIMRHHQQNLKANKTSQPAWIEEQFDKIMSQEKQLSTTVHFRQATRGSNISFWMAAVVSVFRSLSSVSQTRLVVTFTAEVFFSWFLLSEAWLRDMSVKIASFSGLRPGRAEMTWAAASAFVSSNALDSSNFTGSYLRKPRNSSHPPEMCSLITMAWTWALVIPRYSRALVAAVSDCVPMGSSKPMHMTIRFSKPLLFSMWSKMIISLISFIPLCPPLSSTASPAWRSGGKIDRDFSYVTSSKSLTGKCSFRAKSRSCLNCCRNSSLGTKRPSLLCKLRPAYERTTCHMPATVFWT